jgi:hypothetical protein
VSGSGGRESRFLLLSPYDSMSSLPPGDRLKQAFEHLRSHHHGILGFDQERNVLPSNLAMIFVGRTKDGRGLTLGVNLLCYSPAGNSFRRVLATCIIVHNSLVQLRTLPLFRPEEESSQDTGT